MKFEQQLNALIAKLKKLIAKRKKWIKASKENNFDEAIFELLTNLYPDEAHFIYEMLQNAEDAGNRADIKSNTVTFDLNTDKLIFTHQGEPFSFKDIDSITAISQSTKKEDTVAIGKFGIGFKSVFAYTDTPIISDRNMAFEIKDLVVPKLRLDIYKKDKQGVHFEIPFNHNEKSINPIVKSPEECYQQIKQFLENFTGQELLFLRNITKIIVKYDGQEFEYTKTYNKENCIAIISKINKDTGDVTTEEWVTFYKDLPEDKDLYTAFAFKLEKDKIVPIKGKLFVYFPANKTNLNFHIHAPFRPTVARDRIPYKDPQNIKTRDALAEHFKDVILQLHELGHLNEIKDFDIFPCVEDSLPDFYKPLHTALEDTIKTNPILPAQNTGFISVENAIRVKDSKFKDLFATPQARTLLFGENKDYCKESNLRGSDVDKLLSKIFAGQPDYDICSILDTKLDENADFIKQQTDDWIVKLYQYLNDKKWFRIGYILKHKDGDFLKYTDEKPVLNDTTFCPDLYKLCKAKMGEYTKPILKNLGVGELTREEKLNILWNKHKNLCGNSLADVYPANTEQESLKLYKKEFDRLYQNNKTQDICLLSADNKFYPPEDLFVKRLEKFNIEERRYKYKYRYRFSNLETLKNKNIYVLNDIYDDYHDKLSVIKNIKPELFDFRGHSVSSDNPAQSKAQGFIRRHTAGDINYKFNVEIDHIFNNIDIDLSVSLWEELNKLQQSEWENAKQSEFWYNRSNSNSNRAGKNDSTVKIQLNQKWLFDKDMNLVAPNDIYIEDLHPEYELVNGKNLKCILDFKIKNNEFDEQFKNLSDEEKLFALDSVKKRKQSDSSLLDKSTEYTKSRLGKNPLPNSTKIPPPSGGGGYTASIDFTERQQARMEKRDEALDNAIKYYESLDGFNEFDDMRDKQDAKYDLKIYFSDNTELYVKVKGRGADAHLGMTEPQYEFVQQNISNYRFYINTPSGYAEFIYNPKTEQWESTETNHILKIESVKSYIITIE